jgi:exosome complex RNA-binding protein Csl4
MKAQPNSGYVEKGKTGVDANIIGIYITPPKLTSGALVRTRVTQIDVHLVTVKATSGINSYFNNPTAMILNKKDWEKLVADGELVFASVFDKALLAVEVPISVIEDTSGASTAVGSKGGQTDVSVKRPFTDFDSLVSDDYYLVIGFGVVTSAILTYRVASDRVDISQDEYMKHFACDC